MNALARQAGVSVSVATICFDGFGDEDFIPSFARIPHLGIMDVEFNVWYPRNLTPAGLDSIAERSAAISARPTSLQFISPPIAQSFGAMSAEISRWMWLMDAAERLGIRVLKTTGSRRDDGAQLALAVEALRIVGPIATDRNLVIALENHFDNVFERPEDYDRIFDAVDAPSVGMCLDTGHFAASGVDMIELIDRFAERIHHIDLKDCDRAGADQFVPFGEGIVDFDAVLSHAINSGYAGQLVVEFPRSGSTDVLETLRVGVAIAERYATT